MVAGSILVIGNEPSAQLTNYFPFFDTDHSKQAVAGVGILDGLMTVCLSSSSLTFNNRRGLSGSSSFAGTTLPKISMTPRNKMKMGYLFSCLVLRPSVFPKGDESNEST